MAVREAMARMDELYRSVVRRDSRGDLDIRTKKTARHDLLIQDQFVAATISYDRVEEEKRAEAMQRGRHAGGRRGGMAHAFYGNIDDEGNEVSAGGSGVAAGGGTLGIDPTKWECQVCASENASTDVFCPKCGKSKFVADED